MLFHTCALRSDYACRGGRRGDILRNILIVDDEAFARDAMMESVAWEQHGIRAWSAAGGREALQVLSGTKVDLVITDIKMPGMDGMELVRQIRECSPATGVLMLSSYNEFELVRTAMQLGAMDYLFKPTMMPENILAAVQKSLEKLQTIHLKNDRNIFQSKESEELQVKQLFKQLLHGVERGVLNMAELMKDWEQRHIYAIHTLIFTAVKYKQCLNKVFLDKTELMRFSVENVLGESIRNRFLCCMAESSFHEYTVVIWSDKEMDREEGQKKISEMIYECLSFLKAYYQVEFQVGISSSGKDLSQLNTQYLEAKEAAQRAEINYLPICWYAENGNTLARELVTALDFIKDNLGNKELSLQMVAENIGISKNYFSKQFKETMQINFIDYVTNLRLETARKLYQNSDLKIYEIAEKVGYSDWHYLYSLYKKHFGHSLSREGKNPSDE